jgi:hypothetical protein
MVMLSQKNSNRSVISIFAVISRASQKKILKDPRSKMRIKRSAIGGGDRKQVELIIYKREHKTQRLDQ